MDTGDFFDKVGEKFGRNTPFTEIAENAARTRSELAKAAGVNPENYYVVTGNHDLPSTPVLQDGKPIYKTEVLEKMNALSPDQRVEFESKLVQEINADPSKLRQYVVQNIQESDRDIWRKAHEKYGLRLVTSTPNERGSITLPGENFETVLRHFPVNSGPAMSQIADPISQDKLKFERLDSTVGRQIGADIHTKPGNIVGLNIDGNIPLQTVMTPTLGGETSPDVDTGFLLIDGQGHANFLAFEKGTAVFQQEHEIVPAQGIRTLAELEQQQYGLKNKANGQQQTNTQNLERNADQAKTETNKPDAPLEVGNSISERNAQQ